MSAETLRRAASLMRERAEAATSGPWFQGMAQDGEVLPDGTGYIGDYEPTSEVLAFDDVGYCSLEIHAASTRNAAHIASWHPATALAVADWLDTAARSFQKPSHVTLTPSEAAALAVARAYLGESA